ncbi:hypothetical protein VTN49DRAFT_794 [Thermomyces lanuginosus]|uniref:uncharacterized protein n=1 Tax=Thermomyces lanuginosus TaxID=5541 RepID=UPI0037422C55
MAGSSTVHQQEDLCHGEDINESKSLTYTAISHLELALDVPEQIAATNINERLGSKNSGSEKEVSQGSLRGTAERGTLQALGHREGHRPRSHGTERFSSLNLES